jgi:hypothetical protein
MMMMRRVSRHGWMHKHSMAFGRGYMYQEGKRKESIRKRSEGHACNGGLICSIFTLDCSRLERGGVGGCQSLTATNVCVYCNITMYIWMGVAKKKASSLNDFAAACFYV